MVPAIFIVEMRTQSNRVMHLLAMAKQADFQNMQHEIKAEKETYAHKPGACLTVPDGNNVRYFKLSK